MTEGLCIYHGGCTDGVAAAWAVWRKLPNWDFYPGVYQEEPPWYLINRAREVVFVDFSYKRPLMERIAARVTPKDAVPRVTVLDHHASAERELGPLLERGTLKGVFDMEKCGALLAWEWFHGTAPAPELLTYIDARDRWVSGHGLKGLEEVIMALRSYPHAPPEQPKGADGFRLLMECWDGLMRSGVGVLREEGAHIYRYYRQRVRETVARARRVTLAEHTVACVNAPHYLASDVAQEAAEALGTRIGCAWWENKDGSVTFSLRSNGTPDVSKVAEFFGGGGHPGAAGFRVDDLESALALVLDSDA